MQWDEDTLTEEIKLQVRNDLYDDGEAEVIIGHMQFIIEVGLNGHLALRGACAPTYSLDLDFLLGYILGYYEASKLDFG